MGIQQPPRRVLVAQNQKRASQIPSGSNTAEGRKQQSETRGSLRQGEADRDDTTDQERRPKAKEGKRLPRAQQTQLITQTVPPDVWTSAHPQQHPPCIPCQSTFVFSLLTPLLTTPFASAIAVILVSYREHPKKPCHSSDSASGLLPHVFFLLAFAVLPHLILSLPFLVCRSSSPSGRSWQPAPSPRTSF